MLILPIGDEPNDKKHVAWVNYSLIAANVVAFVWMRATYATEAAFQAFILEHAYVPAVGSFDTIFKSMFMHLRSVGTLGCDLRKKATSGLGLGSGGRQQ